MSRRRDNIIIPDPDWTAPEAEIPAEVEKAKKDKTKGKMLS